MWDWWQVVVVVLLAAIFGALMDIRQTLLRGAIGLNQLSRK